MDYKQLRSLSESFIGVIYEKHKKGHDEGDEGDEDYEKTINQEISHKGKSCKEVHPNEDHEEWEMSQNESAAEYFETYFGGELNEDTSDEDIMEAVYDLIELTEAVLSVVMEMTPLDTETKLLTRAKRIDKSTDLISKLDPRERMTMMRAAKASVKNSRRFGAFKRAADEKSNWK